MLRFLKLLISNSEGNFVLSSQKGFQLQSVWVFILVAMLVDNDRVSR